MVSSKHISSRTGKPFAVIHSGKRNTPTILINLLHDTSAPVLALLAEKYGLHRIPGLTTNDMVTRILGHLSDEALIDLQNELVTAHFGDLPIKDLLEIAIAGQQEHSGNASKPRLDQISLQEATLLRSGPPRWEYTMRGHDQMIDLERRLLACDCEFFTFSSKRQVLCKHLATAFQVIPPAYAREALIDLLVLREYGDRREGRWYFESTHAA
jgi:hypothetical protein